MKTNNKLTLYNLPRSTSPVRVNFSSTALINISNTGVVNNSTLHPDGVNSLPLNPRKKFHANLISNSLAHLKLNYNELGFINTKTTQYDIEMFLLSEYTDNLSGKSTIINNVNSK